MHNCDMHPPPIPHKPWKNMGRHIACVPKGFLRFQVLKLLREKPMSGSEIMEAIEKEALGLWRPSPGSIYPLLAWLQDKGYIKEVPSGEGGIRRYTITEQGIKMLDEQIKMQEKMRKMAFFAPFVMWAVHPRMRVDELQASLRRVIVSLMDLREALEEKFEEQALKEAIEVLNNTAKSIEEIARRTKREISR